jgi:hypothetical protein
MGGRSVSAGGESNHPLRLSGSLFVVGLFIKRIVMTKLLAQKIARRSLLKQFLAIPSVSAATPFLSLSGSAWSNTTSNYYFDAINGNDNNPGTSAALPWKGTTSGKTLADRFAGWSGGSGITVNLKRGSVFRSNRTFSALNMSALRVQSYGPPESAAPRFELRLSLADSGTRNQRFVGSWTRVENSQVWRLTVRNTDAIVRLWVGRQDGLETPIEYEDLPARVITRSRSGSEPDPMLLPTESEIVANLTGEAGKNINGEVWDTFWYWGKSLESNGMYCLYIKSSDGNDPVIEFGDITVLMNGYGYGPVFENCIDSLVTDIEVSGAHFVGIRSTGGVMTFERVACRNVSHYGIALQVDSKSVLRSGVFFNGGIAVMQDCVLSTDLKDSKFYIGSSGRDVNTASGWARSNSSNDLLFITQGVKRVKYYRGTIMDGTHTNINVDYIDANTGLEFIVDGVSFDNSNVRYGRAIGVQGKRGDFSKIEVWNSTIKGQPTVSQLGGEAIRVQNCHFSEGKVSVGYTRSKYTGRYVDKRDTANHLFVGCLATGYTDNVVIENCRFEGSKDASIAYGQYGASAQNIITNNVTWAKCSFINTQTQNNPEKLMVYSNASISQPGFNINMMDCYSQGYEKIRYWTGTSLATANVLNGSTTQGERVYLTNHTKL